MAEIQWWYARNDEQIGPVSAADLRRLAAAGTLGPEDLVWREGWAEWAPAARLKGLFPEPPAEPRGESLAAVPIAPPAGDPAASEALPTQLAAQPVEAALPAQANHLADGGTSQSSTPEGATLPEPAAEPIGEVAPASRRSSPSNAKPADSAPTRRPDLQRISHAKLALTLSIVQGVLWGTCVLLVLFGGLLFTIARLNAKTPADEAAVAAVYATFFIGGYVIARAGEKISALVLAYVASRRGR